jgi:hypothetical protein
MKMPKKLPPALAYPVSEIVCQCTRLDQQQGRIARKNARNGVLQSLRNLRRALDTQFPAIRPVKGPSNRLEKLMNTSAPWEKKIPRSPAQLYVVFKRKMRLKDYWPVSHTPLALAIAKGGVRLVDPPKRSLSVIPYAPRWAVLAAQQGTDDAYWEQGKRGANYNVEKVREVRKSITARKALLATVLLSGSV